MPEAGDFVTSHSSGWRRKYLDRTLAHLLQKRAEYQQDDTGKGETRGVFPVSSEESGNCVRFCDSRRNRDRDHVGPLELTVHNVHNFVVHLRGLGALRHRVQNALEVSSKNSHLQ